MKHGSLFSGIGGFDLAAEWMGWETVFHCEINPFGQKVLKHYWPDADLIEDITKFDFKKYEGTIDIISGGFPCQPFSLAGKRKGTEDDRHLWPEMLRVIREVRPTWVVGENVFGIINWDGGLVFDQVQSDLEAEGYEVQPYVLPAVSVNAPHRRDRVWFVAYCCNLHRSLSIQQRGQNKAENINTNRKDESRVAPDTGGAKLQGRTPERNGKDSSQKRAGLDNRTERQSNIGDAPDTGDHGSQRGERREAHGQRNRTETSGSTAKRFEIRSWDNWPTQPPICSRDDGISSELDGITFPKWRNESIKAYGNAVVPPLVYQIFKAIAEHDNLCINC